MIYYTLFAMKMKAILKTDNQYSFKSKKSTQKTQFLSSHMMQNEPSSRNPQLKNNTISERRFSVNFVVFFIIFTRIHNAFLT